VSQKTVYKDETIDKVYEPDEEQVNHDGAEEKETNRDDTEKEEVNIDY
jgi:hypothetical protein